MTSRLTPPSHPGQSDQRFRNRRHNSGGRWLALLALMVLAAVAWWSLRNQPDAEPVSARSVPVTTATAYQGTLVIYASQPGKVKPSNSVVIRSRVDGQITRIAFSGGEMVQKGTLLAEIDPGPYHSLLQQAEGDLVRSQVQLESARDMLKRYQVLLKQDSITAQRVADQQSLVREYAAAVKANQARRDASNLQISYTRITAPIAGMVGLRRVDPGNMISASDPHGITVVTQSQPSIVEFSIPVASTGRVLDWLHTGNCIPVDIMDSAKDVVGTGFLRAVNNQADPATGTVRLEAEFPNREGTLLPNQFVTVKMPERVLSKATLVPTAAIQQGAAGAFVYIIRKDQTAAIAPVQIGPSDATTTAIESGLTPGVQVVVEGADRLRADTRVQITAQTRPSSSSDNSLPQCLRDENHKPPHSSGHTNMPGANARPQPDSAVRP